ncbi:hypothetical protein [uncultured Clostridium sp.]|uniref:hypothetical protein n=1 Tax=uncultured Clostridium sp. TaxID=59620 RepID=UPI0028F16C02|nr:hypothetical protein [uncultured Clostridium sp.]
MRIFYKRIIVMFVMVLTIMSIGIMKNEIVANAATVGQQLTQPEEGWRRFDDTDSNITYSSNIKASKESGNYMSTYHGVCKTKLGETIKFNFTGDKIRLIGLISSNYTHKIKIEIDGQEDYFDSNLNSTKYNDTFSAVMYSKENLSEGIHCAVITHIEYIENPLTYDFRLDAIDIDENGELLPYEEIETPEEPNYSDKTGAILIINLVDGETKVYDVSSSEVKKFLEWYDDNDTQTYKFKKEVNSKISINEYVVHDKITMFEVRKY